MNIILRNTVSNLVHSKHENYSLNLTDVVCDKSNKVWKEYIK